MRKNTPYPQHMNAWKPRWMCARIRNTWVQPSHWLEWMTLWARLLCTGISVNDALDTSISLLPKGRAYTMLAQCLQWVTVLMRSGQNPSDAFQNAAHRMCLDLPEALTIALRCAQSNGLLGETLNAQITHWAQQQEAKHRLFKSMIYPVFVLLACIGSVVLMMQAIGPHAAVNHSVNPDQAQSHVSALTSIMHVVFSPSQWGPLLAQHAGIALMGFGAVLLCLALWHKHKSNSKKHLNTPISHTLGNIWPQRPAKLANCFHIMACELEAGMDLLHVLQTNPPHHKHRPPSPLRTNPIEHLLHTMNQGIAMQLRQGEKLHVAMQRSGAPIFLVKQAQLAEYSGDIAQCYALAAQVYRIETARRQRRLEALSGPITLSLAAIILILGYQASLGPLYASMGKGF